MASRDPSAAPSSGGDTIEDQVNSSKLVASNLDREHEDPPSDYPQAADTPPATKSSKRGRSSTARKPRPKKIGHVWVHEGPPPADMTEDEATTPLPSKVKGSGSPDEEGKTQGTVVGTRRQANGTVGSVYSGSKIRHIKKPDGTPLWRKEIQYEFLKFVIEDTTPCFTRISDGKAGFNFADIYIDCMARSSKTSKILKDRLQVDRQAAQNMAMICLLVNVGRMNTTLNFFPEMRAQLRTYHSIPSLQGYRSQRDYKSLQDAPRLKSILKGASEDTDEPRNLAQLRSMPVPRTNAVNLIFVLSHFAPEIAQIHFTDKVDFFDLAIRPTISSRTRATAFLWLMWWYLESNFDKESALHNPFGPGEYKDSQDTADPTEVPQLVPRLVTISEEEGDAENIDPEEEKAFAEKMTKERKRIMTEVANEDTVVGSGRELEHKGVKRLKKSARDQGGEDDSDADSLRGSPGASARSPAPGESVTGPGATQIVGSLQTESVDEDWDTVDANPSRGRLKRLQGKKTPSRSKMRNSEVGGVAGSVKGTGRSRLGPGDRGTPDTSRGTPQPLPPGMNHHPVLSHFPGNKTRHELDLMSNTAAGQSKSRARTGYQRELEEHKNRRIEWLLNKKRREALKEAKQKREQGRWLLKVARRVTNLSTIYDSASDEEGLTNLFESLAGVSSLNSYPSIGIGGLIGRRYAVNANVAKSESGDESVPKPLPPQASPNDALEEEDYGEEAESWLKVFRRTQRRLQTWSGDKDHEIFVTRKQRAADVAAGGDKLLRRITSEAGAGINTSSTRKRNDNGHRVRNGDMSLNDEITQDLLAERSGDEDDEDGDVDMTMEYDNENARVPLSEDSDVDVDMD